MGFDDFTRDLDLDDVFAYKTPHTTLIRDRRLGLLSIGLKVCLAFYIVYQMLGQGGYLENTPAQGVGRFTLDQPTNNCTYAQRNDPVTKPFCKSGCTVRDDISGCYDAFPNVTELPYCMQSPIPYSNTSTGRKGLNCRFYEAAAVELVFQGSILVATQGVEIFEEKSCSASMSDPLYKGGVCDRVYNADREEKYYYADVTEFDVDIYHSLSHPVQLSSLDMPVGKLYIPADPTSRNRTDAICREKGVTTGGNPTTGAPCFVVPERKANGADSVKFNDILLAALLDLDDVIPGQDGLTTRNFGATIIFEIRYSNWNAWEIMTHMNSPHYEYYAHPVFNNSYTTTEAIYDVYPFNRTVLYRSGVHIVAEQTGLLYQFSFATMMITLTTSLTILAVAAVITDEMATKVLPAKSLYEDYMQRWTPDMSDVREGLVCATCSRALIPVVAGGESGATLMNKTCGICASVRIEGDPMYLCTHCDHLRCTSCLPTCTSNRPPFLDVDELALKLFGQPGAYALTHDEVVTFFETLEIVKLIGWEDPLWAAVPTQEEFYDRWLEDRIIDSPKETQTKFISLLLRKQYVNATGDTRHMNMVPLWAMRPEKRDEAVDECKKVKKGTVAIAKEEKKQRQLGSPSPKSADESSPLITP